MSRLPPLLARRHAARWAGLLACGVLLAACAGGAALAVRLAFDGGRVAAATPLAATLAACAVLGALATVWERRLAEALAQAHIARIRRNLVRALFDREVGDAAGGTAMLRFIGDLGAVREWIAHGAAAVPVAAVVAPTAIALLAWLAPALALPAVLAAAASILALRALGARLEDAQDAARRDRVRLARAMAHPLSRPAPYVLAGEERRLLRRLDRLSAGIAGSAVQRRMVAASGMALSDAAIRLGGAAILWLGLQAIARGAIDSGTLAAALALSGFLGTSLHRLAAAWDKWHAVRVANRRLDAHLARAQRRAAPRAGASLPAGPVGLAATALRLRPDGPLLDLELVPGEVVCLRCDDEADGERLLRLLAGLADAAVGRVSVGGLALETIARADVRQAIAVIGPIAGPSHGSLRGHLRRATAQRTAGRVASPPGQIPDLAPATAAGLRFGAAPPSIACATRAQLAIAAARGARIYLLQQPAAALDDLAIAHLLREARRRRATVLAFGPDARRAREADRVLLLDAGGLRPLVRTAAAGAPHADSHPR